MYGLLFAAITCFGAPNVEASEADLQLRVRRFVRQLDSLRLAERDAAEAAILDLGPIVLDHLPPVTDRTPEGVAQRLGRVRQKLEQTVAQTMADASTITLQSPAIRLAQILAAIEEQSGNRIIDARAQFGHEPADPELPIDFQQLPFWRALDTVLDMAGLTVYPYGEQRAVYVVSRPDGRSLRAGRAHYTGPMRIEPVLIRAENDLVRSGPARLEVTHEIVWEPRVRPISLEQPMSDVEAKDERGEALVVDDPEATLQVPAEGDQFATSLVYSFQAPARGVERIESLRGSLRALIPGKVAIFRFDSILQANHVRQRIGGATVTLEHVRRSGPFWEVSLRVRFDDAGPALESHRGWIFDNPAYLVAPGGERIAYARFETTMQAENEVGMAYLFELEEPPERLQFVYETPALVLGVQLPYESKDIPLP